MILSKGDISDLEQSCPMNQSTQTQPSEENMSLTKRKPVFEVCNQVRLKPACTATEAS